MAWIWGKVYFFPKITLKIIITDLPATNTRTYFGDRENDAGGEESEEGGGALHTHRASLSGKSSVHSSRPPCTIFSLFAR